MRKGSAEHLWRMLPASIFIGFCPWAEAESPPDAQGQDSAGPSLLACTPEGEK